MGGDKQRGERQRGHKKRKEMERQSGRVEKEDQMAGPLLRKRNVGEKGRYCQSEEKKGNGCRKGDR